MIKKIALLFLIIFTNVVNAEQEVNFDVVMVEKTNGTWRAIKYNLYTGESWYIRNGVFIRLPDSEVLPKSRYKVVATKHKGGWGAVKMDLVSGNAWWLKGELFVRVKDTK